MNVNYQFRIPKMRKKLWHFLDKLVVRGVHRAKQDKSPFFQESGDTSFHVKFGPVQGTPIKVRLSGVRKACYRSSDKAHSEKNKDFPV